MTHEATVAIITVTYNASGFIERYLEKVAGVLGSRPQTKLFVVDNDSRDDTLERVGRFVADKGLEAQIAVIATGENLGFGRGCNRGAEEAKQGQVDYLWFLNPDTQPTREALEAMLKVFDQEDAAFVGCQLSDQFGDIRTGAYRFPRLLTVFLSEATLGVLDQLFSTRVIPIPIGSEPVRADWVTGASFIASREAFELVGGFDPRYFLYFEEVDLFLRAHRMGLQVWTTPHGHVHHISGASTGINKKDGAPSEPHTMPSFWYESRRYFYVKNYGAMYGLTVDLCVTIGRCIALGKGILRGRRHPVKDVSRTLLQQNLEALWHVLTSWGSTSACAKRRSGD